MLYDSHFGSDLLARDRDCLLGHHSCYRYHVGGCVGADSFTSMDDSFMDMDDSRRDMPMGME